MTPEFEVTTFCAVHQFFRKPTPDLFQIGHDAMTDLVRFQLLSILFLLSFKERRT
jgi:hypothetical protein